MNGPFTLTRHTRQREGAVEQREREVLRDGGVVHQHIQPVPGSFQSGDHLLGASAVRCVDAKAERLGAELGQLAARLFGGLFVLRIREGDARTVPGEGERDGATQAARTSRDQRSLAGQELHALGSLRPQILVWPIGPV